MNGNKKKARKRALSLVTMDARSVTGGPDLSVQQPFVRSAESALPKTPLEIESGFAAQRRMVTAKHAHPSPSRRHEMRATPRRLSPVARPSKDFQDMATWTTPHSQLSGVALSPNGRVIATAGVDQICLWSRDGSLLHSFHHSGAAFSCLAFGPNAKILAAGTHDGTIHLWKLPGSRSSRIIEHVHLQGHETMINDLDFHHSGLFLATGGFDQVVHVWNLNDGKLELELTDSEAEITSLTFSDAAIFATQADGRIRQWNRNGTAHVTLPGGALPVSIDHGADETIWCTTAGEVCWERNGSVIQVSGHEGEATAVCIRATGWFASGGEDGVARLYYRGRMSMKRQLQGPIAGIDLRGNTLAVGTTCGTVSLFGQSCSHSAVA